MSELTLKDIEKIREKLEATPFIPEEMTKVSYVAMSEEIFPRLLKYAGINPFLLFWKWIMLIIFGRVKVGRVIIKRV